MDAFPRCQWKRWMEHGFQISSREKYLSMFLRWPNTSLYVRMFCGYERTLPALRRERRQHLDLLVASSAPSVVQFAFSGWASHSSQGRHHTSDQWVSVRKVPIRWLKENRVSDWAVIATGSLDVAPVISWPERSLDIEAGMGSCDPPLLWQEPQRISI